MGRTQKDHKYIEDQGLWRENMNTTTPSHAVITKILPGQGVSLQSTGIDPGTGDVTIHATGTPSGVDELVKISATDTTPGFLSTKFTTTPDFTLTTINSAGDERMELSLNTTVQNTQYIQQTLSRKGEVKEGKWLKLEDISTDKVPFVLPVATTKVTLILSNKTSNTGTIEVYKNGILFTQITLVNESTKTSSVNLPSSPNDTFAAKGVSGKLKDVILQFLFEA